MKFSRTVDYVTEQCCVCHVMFAMTAEFQAQRQRDKKTFYCPVGHAQHYNGQSLGDKNKELSLKLREAQNETLRVKNQLRETTKSICTLRKNVKEDSKDLPNYQLLKKLRINFAMTQELVANEVGVSAATISNYERGCQVSSTSEWLIESWIHSQ